MDTLNKSTLALCAALAVLGIALASAAGLQADENVAQAFERTMNGEVSEGTVLPDYGEPTVIELSPGFKWTYDLVFPDDLEEHLAVELAVNDEGIGKLSADGRALSAVIAANAPIGKVYDIVVRAYMTSPVEQERFQYIQLKVVEGLAVSGNMGNIILGDTVDFVPEGVSSMGEVTWSVVELPDGLSFSNGKVTGKPTAIGPNTIKLRAAAQGESRDLEMTFTVFSKISGASDQTIKALGRSASSNTIGNPQDLMVRWDVESGEIPDGFSLDPETGIVSGRSDITQKTTVTLIGRPTADGCPSQSATAKITIFSEKALQLSGGDGILTYKNNPEAVTSIITAENTSGISWSDDCSDATVANGVVSVVNAKHAGMGQTITVTASTEYGQTSTKSVRLDIEDTLSLSAIGDVSIVAGTEKALQLTVQGGSGNRFDGPVASDASLHARFGNGCLYIESDSVTKNASVNVTVRSAAGQTAEATVNIDVYSTLVFTSSPTNGAIVYAL